MKIEINLEKKYFLISLGIVLLLTGIFIVIGAFPNPGHPASEIGSGTFYDTPSVDDTWTFPGKIDPAKVDKWDDDGDEFIDCQYVDSSLCGNQKLDCYDGNTNAKPGQTAWFTVERGDGNFDYNCNGVTDYQYPQAFGCQEVTTLWRTSITSDLDKSCGVDVRYVSSGYCFVNLYNCQNNIGAYAPSSGPAHRH